MTRWSMVLLTWAIASAQAVPGRAQDDGSQVGDRTDQGLSREQMWRAPTAEDWAKDTLIRWQRTWDDAVNVSQETGRPILVCTNMDGEIASEHYAGIRYRQPEVAELYAPYVTVIASVYRHNPRDYDVQGRRIPCPRFGTVTCGEHIAIEPVVYERFFDGRRIAPRHVMVELDGSEVYDIFYAFDTASVFDAVRDGVSDRPPVPPRGDRPLTERVASRDVIDREAVEAAYRDGNDELRGELLQAAQRHAREASPVDLLRLAAFGFDAELGRAARDALTNCETVDATDLISDVLSTSLERAERDALIGTLESIGESSPRAETLAVVHRGLASDSTKVNVGDWSAGLADADPSATALTEYERRARFDTQNRVLSGTDAEEHVALAEVYLERAFDAQTRAVDAATETEMRLAFMDARSTATKSLELGAAGWRPHAVLALAHYYLQEPEAQTHAEQAVDSLPPGEASFRAMAVLELFAKLRCQGIAAAMRDRETWPREWLTDVNAACDVLADHPLGTAAQVGWHYDILQWLGGKGQAGRVLDRGLGRFPVAAELHERLRGRLLRDVGVEGLEATYARLLEGDEVPAGLSWFAAYASFTAAEFHRRRGRTEDALASYGRALERFEAYGVEVENADDIAAHWVALSHAGRSRIHFEAQAWEPAVDAILASFDRRADTAATLDGLNLSPADTAKVLLARLRDDGHQELAQRLRAGMDALSPELLALPAYEREVGPDGQPRRGGGAPPWRRDRGASGPGEGGRDQRTTTASVLGDPGETLGLPAPGGAVQLVGRKVPDQLVSERAPETDLPWMYDAEAGTLTVVPGAGDLRTTQTYDDFRMHVEFATNASDNEWGNNGNSGVYIQRRYEVQILNSKGRTLTPQDCGALYRTRIPDANASRGPGEWQTYDIAFRAARWDGTTKVAPARITVHHNGVVIHDDVEIQNKTGAGLAEGPNAEFIRLQEHGNAVAFRNVWIQPLTSL